MVVESGSAGSIGNAQRTLTQLPAVYRDPEITLYRIGGMSQAAPHAERMAVTAAHVVWLAMVTGAGFLTLAGRRHKDVPSGT